METYKKSIERDHDLLCDLYQHEIVLFHDLKRNPNLFVGDIQLRYFNSYMHNHLQWNQYQSTIVHNEQNFSLWVRREYPNHVFVIGKCREFLKSYDKVVIFVATQQELIFYCKRRVNLMRMDALLACKQRWDVYDEMNKRRDPLC